MVVTKAGFVFQFDDAPALGSGLSSFVPMLSGKPEGHVIAKSNRKRVVIKARDQDSPAAFLLGFAFEDVDSVVQLAFDVRGVCHDYRY
jgi:hypothetical protein